MSAMTATTAEWTGRQVVDTTGEKIGTVSRVYFDKGMEHPQWLVIKTGLFGSKRVVAPAQEVRSDGDRLMLPYTKDRVKEAPDVDGDEGVSHDEERELFEYYGLDLTEQPFDREMVGSGRRDT